MSTGRDVAAESPAPGRNGGYTPSVRAERDPRSPWLVLVHQLPAEPSKLRVKAWRRLQGAGAVAVKNSVYVLPDTRDARETFEWIRTEIVAQGGEALVFTAAAVDELSAAELQDAFDRVREGDWLALGERAAQVLEGHRPGRVENRREVQRQLRALRSRADEIDAVDLTGVPGRREALAAVQEVAALLDPGPASRPRGPRSKSPADYQGRVWLTRPRPAIDRMASAWLIRRFIDREAVFRFADRVPPDEETVPFDMYGADLGHRGESVTFEALLDDFCLTDPALRRVARIVHQVDLKHDLTEDPEATGLAALVEGLRASIADDTTLLDHGMALFEAFHRSLGSRG